MVIQQFPDLHKRDTRSERMDNKYWLLVLIKIEDGQPVLENREEKGSLGEIAQGLAAEGNIMLNAIPITEKDYNLLRRIPEKAVDY
jgi:hypothetical protein